MSIRTNDGQKSVEQLYHEHRRPIQAYLARLIDDHETAEDLCQETFFKALRGWNGHDPAASPVGWLYRIATNTAYDYLRRRRYTSHAPLFAAEFLSSGHTPESRIETAEPVRSALEQLPPHYRAPLLMQACAGQSMREIAETLGCSCDAVKMRLLRARARFRQVYQG
jgi:RNA polymerase sigma-70 factor (ECF subfamily)